MAGDVNLFFNDDEDPSCAEIEVMIAEANLRRRGLAREALTLLMRYAMTTLGTTKFVAKIGEVNEPSLKLFEAIGYERVAFVEAFNEHTLTLDLGALRKAGSPLPTWADMPVTALEDKDQEELIYERPESVDQYLALHFGQHPEVVRQTVRSEHFDFALEFPKRCAELLVAVAKEAGAPVSRQAKALDLGCAVGGSSFELTKTYGFVRGIDFSASFIAAAKQVRDSSAPVTFRVKVEGDIYREGIPVHLDPQVSRARVEFSVGDACQPGNVASLGGPFDAVLLGNLLCRVPDPMEMIRALVPLTTPRAVILFVSPYSWLEMYTEKSRWFQQGNGSAEVRLEQEMERLGFSVVKRGELAAVIREHERLYQTVLSSTVAFQRKESDKAPSTSYASA